MVTFPGQFLLFVPLVQMSTTEPIMWFISPTLALPPAGPGTNPRMRIFDLAVVICLFPGLFSLALSWVTKAQLDLETLSFLPEADVVFFGAILLPTILIAISKPVKWFISQVRSRNLLSDASMRRVLSIALVFSPYLIRFAMNGIAIKDLLEMTLVLVMAFAPVYFKAFFYINTPAGVKKGEKMRNIFSKYESFQN